MSKELETQIEDELFNEKLKKFYLKNKILIILFIFLVLTIPLLFQFYKYYQLKQNEKSISLYVQSKLLSEKEFNKKIQILEKLKIGKNETTKFLAVSELIEIYTKKNNKQKAIFEIDSTINQFTDEKLIELLNIKKVIIKFDTINEKEILDLLNLTKNSNFKIIKNKLLYDFYIKNNQTKKALQFQNK